MCWYPSNAPEPDMAAFAAVLQLVFSPDGRGPVAGWGALDDVVMGGVSSSGFFIRPGKPIAWAAARSDSTEGEGIVWHLPVAPAHLIFCGGICTAVDVTRSI